jgi:Gpi18-like mannosyltransferase
MDVRQHLLPWWVECIGLWLATLLGLTLVGMLAARMALPNDMGAGYVHWPFIAPENPPGLWLRWDANFYLTIARDGYAPHANMCGFFPLYPLLIALLSAVAGCGAALSAMLIAQLSYLAAILGFYKLARLVHDEHSYAMWCVAFLVLFPSAFFFYALYAEALYLACAVWGVYFILRQRPHYAGSGILLALASLARPVGWLLSVIVAAEYWFRRKSDHPLSLWRTLLTLALAASGTVAFVAFLYFTTRSFTAITDAQAQWGRHWNWPWTTIWISIEIALSGGRVPGNWFLYAINWADLLVTLFALGLTGIALYRSMRGHFPGSLALYLVVSLIFTLSSEGPHFTADGQLDVVPLWGMTRWVSALFPIFLVMGDLFKKSKLRWAAVVSSASLMIACAAWWMTGRWVG